VPTKAAKYLVTPRMEIVIRFFVFQESCTHVQYIHQMTPKHWKDLIAGKFDTQGQVKENQKQALR
jgi:hypothetical protein